MDIICASAVDELLTYNTGKPIILAETGAVEPRHAGPSKYYPLDTAGILLHDILFAPFFSGSAGAGMSWHWESYVHKNNLWYHFKRFNEAIKGINPIEEKFIPVKQETDAVNMYQLKGNSHTLIWIRDKNSNWKSELEQGVAPQYLQGIQLQLDELGIASSTDKVEVYDPWTDTWTTSNRIDNHFPLPDFKRSLIVRINFR
jgi:hypothetical protein